ncbi:MAG: hypothetical protein QG597_5182, partial [Actinomycetota bacterium]|nr:hypothetical protein [Actinomycetota bacterium]
ESADGSAQEFVRSFAAMAELLEHPRKVVAAVTAQPRRPVPTGLLAGQ